MKYIIFVYRYWCFLQLCFVVNTRQLFSPNLLEEFCCSLRYLSSFWIDFICSLLHMLCFKKSCCLRYRTLRFDFLHSFVVCKKNLQFQLQVDKELTSQQKWHFIFYWCTVIGLSRKRIVPPILSIWYFRKFSIFPFFYYSLTCLEIHFFSPKFWLFLNDEIIFSW